MKTIDILKDCDALLEGHFLLSSGRHSNTYFQCARLLQFPKKAELVLRPLADHIQQSALRPDVVVGPALGGIIVAYELGRLLDVPAFFTERADDGRMALRRGFDVQPEMRILIAEDVVTTGTSSLESIAVLEAFGAKVVALSCIVDRRAAGVTLGLPLFAACTAGAENWDAENCPLCAQGIPAIKPGSRKLKV